MGLPSPKGSKMGDTPHLPGHVTWTPPRGLRRIERVAATAPMLAGSFRRVWGSGPKSIMETLRPEGVVFVADGTKVRHQKALALVRCVPGYTSHIFCFYSSSPNSLPALTPPAPFQSLPCPSHPQDPNSLSPHPWRVLHFPNSKDC